MARTNQVFTPNTTPTLTTIKRKAIWDNLSEDLELFGSYVSVLGTTKLGKSTLIKSTIADAPFSHYIPGQNLIEGPQALWRNLASKLEIPVSTTTGKATTDKSKWGFVSKLAAALPSIVSISASASIGGEHTQSNDSTNSFETDVASAVAEALAILGRAAQEDGASMAPVLAIDDFHFITDIEIRRSLLQALRPLTDFGLSVVLATLPGRGNDAAFQHTNVGGRKYDIHVPSWKIDELSAIAWSGFKTLHLRADAEIVARLARESYGSPQIMQTLCYKLVRNVNGIAESVAEEIEVAPPEDWPSFFRSVKDSESVGWLETLGFGPTQRRPRKRATLPDGQELDGYQLLLWALNTLGTPEAVSFIDVRAEVFKIIRGSSYKPQPASLETKAKNMNVLASREMQDALERISRADSIDGEDEDFDLNNMPAEELSLANLIPQPVFEVTGDRAADMKFRILDPLFAYTLRWHPETIIRTS